MAGIANLTTLALERYVTLVGSDRQKELLKKTQVFLIITVWLYAFLVSVPPLLGWGRFAQDTFVASCSFDFYSNDMNAQSYFMFLLTVGFFVPLTISGLYIAIYRKIQKYRKHFESAQLDNQIVTQKRRCLSVPWDIEVFNDKATDVNSCWVSNDKPRCISSDEIPLSCQAENDLNTHKFDNESIPMSRRLALAEVKFAEQTFFMILGYVVCWAPYAILTIMCHIGVIACYNPIASAVSLMLAKGSVAINPVIYAFSGKKSEEA